MPELPEVETVRKGLQQLVIGKTIADVTVLWPRIIDSKDTEQFKLDLLNQKIIQIDRRGKFLIFKLADFDLISHLRMEGKYEFFPFETSPSKHTHVIFTFTDGSQLHYRDVRKFGRMTLVTKDTSMMYSGIKKLGPEPVLPDFDFKQFHIKLKQSKKAIKPLLLDQHLVTGLGNIYVDEALWKAQIHPETSANLLRLAEVKELHQAIIDVLHEAVVAGGTTIRTYKNALGEAGTFQVQLHAYGQEGVACVRCGTPLLKTKVAQRGTHFCPSCQKKRG